MLKMVCQDDLTGLFQGSLYRGDLQQEILALFSFFGHPLDTADMAFNFSQAIGYLFASCMF
jgi:hypothetical protein